jgi:hypothetical protein
VSPLRERGHRGHALSSPDYYGDVKDLNDPLNIAATDLTRLRLNFSLRSTVKLSDRSWLTNTRMRSRATSPLAQASSKTVEVTSRAWQHPAPRPDRAPGRFQAHVITAMSSSADGRAFAAMHERVVCVVIRAGHGVEGVPLTRASPLAWLRPRPGGCPR